MTNSVSALLFLSITPLLAQNPMVAEVFTADAVFVFLLACLVSGLAGIAAALRNEQGTSLLRLFTVALNSCLLGLGLSMVWHSYFQTNPGLLVGLCVLIGLGGQPVLEMVVEAVKNGSLSINFKDGGLRLIKKEDKEKPQEPNQPGEKP